MNSDFIKLDLRNESDVEQKFIYPLLINLPPAGLGYLEEDILTKVNIKKLKIDKGNSQKIYYPDYAIILDGLPLAIIEAKSPGELNDAYREARLYASEINSSYPHGINPCKKIIVTDGNEIIIGNWDSEDYTAKILRTEMFPISNSLSLMQDIISKKSLAIEVKEILSKIRKSSRYFKPKYMLGGKTVMNETVGDNSFGSNISIEYRHLFNPVSTEQRDLVVLNAYVTSKRKLSHVEPIEKIVRAAIPSHINESLIIKDTRNPKELLEKLHNHTKLKHEVCLLIGSVGSGKSTFTDYLRVVALPEAIKKSTDWININLNEAPLERSMIYRWVIEKAIQKIAENNKSVDFDHIDTLYSIYCKQISALEKGRAALFPKGSERHSEIIYKELEALQGDKDVTLECIIDFLARDLRKNTVIVLDNCDKGNAQDQLLMFEVANWLKKRFECIVFLPIRDATYEKYKDQPPLDTVIKDLVFRIDPPLLEQVIYKRLQYLSRELVTKKGTLFYFLKNGIRVECSYNEVERYIRSIIQTLFQDTFFRRVIVGLAGRNIRKGLEMVLDFCKSGHIPEEEILRIRQSDGDVKVPPHLISKILLKGNRKYYNDTDSHLKNIFHSYEDDYLPDPFVRLSILHILSQKYREFGPNRTKGYHRVSDLLKILQYSGHGYERSFEEIISLSQAGCIISESQNREVTKEDLVSIAPSGFIHLEIMKNTSYLSAVSEDTLFRENQPAASIRDNIIGAGDFRPDSKQVSILNSKILVTYLNKYYQENFIGAVRLLEDEVANCKITQLYESIILIAENDEAINHIRKVKSLYPVGSQVDAQIVSVQNYGVFVEFGINGLGLIHKSNLNQVATIDECEVGDWVIVEVLQFSTEHKRFKLKLIDK